MAECVQIGADDIDGLVKFSVKHFIDFVVVGPEAPLVAGLVDRLEEMGIKAFGPSTAAAQLEASKGFTKDLCNKYGIPTAAYGRFTETSLAKAFIQENGAPIVVKADGLAAGKGVIIAETIAEAETAVDDMLSVGTFGTAGAEIVIEEFLTGEEASFFALVDGTHALPLVSAQDHKRVGEGDIGPNTGGMGAYSPAAIVTEAMEASVMEQIIMPTVEAMRKEGTPYKGVLYAGLMIEDGAPKLLEYNVRFGDPECQVLMVRLMSDLLPALIATRDGVLDMFDLRWHEEAALCVVMASKGYPGAYELGTEICELEAASALDDVMIFHAGTRIDKNRVLANGGRVLGVTALSTTIADAQAKAYEAAGCINWPQGFYRRDIGWRAI